MPMNSECSQNAHIHNTGCLRAVEPPSCLIPRLWWSGRVCLFSPFGGDLQWVYPTESLCPKLWKPPEKNTLLPAVSLISGLPSLSSFPLHSLWGDSRPEPTLSFPPPASAIGSGLFLWPLWDHHIKAKYPMEYIPQVCVWVLPRVR